MKKDNVIELSNPAKSIVEDQLTMFLREQAQAMLRVAIETEVSEFISQHRELTLANGHQWVVRNGHLPERGIHTGIGTIRVKVPRIRDRGNAQDPIHFQSSLVPQYMRRSATLDVLLPLMYLKRIAQVINLEKFIDGIHESEITKQQNHLKQQAA